MFKIEIQVDDGRELKVSQGGFIYYKGADGKDTYWEWEHLAADEKFEAIFAGARALVDKAEERLPNLPMTGLR